MSRRAVAILGAVLVLAGCQSVGPVHLGEINQLKALKLSREELGRRHMEAVAGWRAEVTDYATIWVVTYYRPAERADGPPFVRVSLNKHSEKVVAVTTGE